MSAFLRRHSVSQGKGQFPIYLMSNQCLWHWYLNEWIYTAATKYPWRYIFLLSYSALPLRRLLLWKPMWPYFATFPIWIQFYPTLFSYPWPSLSCIPMVSQVLLILSPTHLSNLCFSPSSLPHPWFNESFSLHIAAREKFQTCKVYPILPDLKSFDGFPSNMRKISYLGWHSWSGLPL